MSSLPSNIHVSTHPLLAAKLSQLRSKSANARDTKSLIHEITSILSCDALAGLQLVEAGTVSYHKPSFLHIHDTGHEQSRESSETTDWSIG